MLRDSTGKGVEMLRFFCSFDGFKIREHLDGRFTRGSTSTAIDIITTAGRNGKGALYLGEIGPDVNGVSFELPSGPHTSGIVLGIAYKRYSSPPARLTGIFTLKNSGGSKIFTLLKNAGGYLEARKGSSIGTLLGTGVINIDNGTWYFIELKLTIHASTGTVEVHVDGAEDTPLTLTGQNTEGATGGATQCTLHGIHSAYEVVGFLFDDLYFADAVAGIVTDFVGNCQSTVTVPAAETAQIEFTPLSGTDNSDMVDEALPNDDVDYNQSTTSGHKDRFTVVPLGLSGVEVLGVSVTSIAKEPSAGGSQIKNVLKSGTTEESGDAKTLNTDYKSQTHLWEVDPDTLVQWVPADVDGVEIGYELV